MKHKKHLSCLIAAALAFCLGFGGAACMVTGLGLSAPWLLLLLGCALSAILAVVCFSARRFGKPVGVCWAGCGLWLLMGGSFLEQLKAMCRTILTYYHNGYGIPIPGWLEGAAAESHLLPLLVISTVVSTAAVWTVLRRKPALFAVIPALLPLISCIVVTDTVPNAISIVILLAGLMLLLMTQPVRRRSAGDANRLTGILAPLVLAALVLLTALVPREGYQTPALADSLTGLFNWAARHLPYVVQTADGELIVSFGSAITDEVDLSSTGPRTYQNRAILEVTSDQSGLLYLRGRDYDRYDGLSWTATEDRTEAFLAPGFQTDSVGRVTIKTLGRMGQYYLPCYPRKQQLLTGGMAENPGYDTEYTFEYSSAIWITASEADPRYLELPDSTRLQAEAIVNTIPSQTNPLNMALAIREYVENSAAYDLNTQRMPEGETDFALWFLDSSDTGYCVHFASAATVLLRAAGIPARYVEGYTVQTEAGQTVTVRDRMAHAWVEYYLDHVGWVILDSTPSASDEPEVTTLPTSTAPSTEATQPPTTAPSTEATQPQTTAPSAPRPTPGDEKAELPGWFTALLRIVAWAAVLALLTAAQWLLRRHWRIRQLHRGNLNDQALARYREAKRLAKLSKAPLPEELTILAEKAKFSQHTLTREELAQFDAFARHAVKTLRRRPWYYRIVCRLIFAAY